MNKEVVISAKHINRFAIIFLVSIFVVLYLPFTACWGWQFTFTGFENLVKDILYWIVPLIIFHEGLHGTTWAIVSRSFKNIRFGFNREMLAPYTHCNIPLSKINYILGGLAPLIILGIVPGIIFFIAGNPYWYTLSLFCIFTSGGDILSCYCLIRILGQYKVQDHPEKLGFILIEE